MNAIVIEHVPVAELPQAWRDRLGQSVDARVTVRIEAEAPMAQDEGEDALFGMWRDREDMGDVAGYIRRIRASRLGRGSREA
ncbi:MAG TPA: hypothetical protein VGM81_15905 [Burkholderiaceae bacterium]|jgi:hypothetical protein